MALPPERLLLRRKRDEEPVDHLLIQRESKRVKTPFETEYHFIRSADHTTQVKSSITNLSSNQNQNISNNPQVPAVRTTLPGDEYDNQFSSPAKKYTAKQKDGQATFEKSAIQPWSNPKSTPRTEPRTFYLRKPSPPDPLRLKFKHDGVQKYGRKQRSALAVFTERSPTAPKDVPVQPSLPRAGHGLSSIHLEQQNRHLNGEITSRKRPNASAEEQRWRRENWDRYRQSHGTQDMNIDHSMSGPDADDSLKKSLELAADLQSFVMQETALKDSARLKFQPKCPHPRYKNIEASKSVSQPDLESTTDLEMNIEESDYVYDTYIRHLNSSHNVLSKDLKITDPLQHLDGQKCGLLVITEEDEEAWEAYGEDDLSEKDWNSEEEDENAEDFHGNDYPEDEVDSEDEHGRGAYGYRHRASDDEEYENDDGVWSDEESESQSPWTRNR